MSDNITSMDELINPNEFTEKELLKLVYRELHTLREEFDNYRKNNTWQTQITEQDKRLVQLEEKARFETAMRQQAEKRQSRYMTYVTVGLTILTVVFKFIVK